MTTKSDGIRQPEYRTSKSGPLQQQDKSNAAPTLSNAITRLVRANHSRCATQPLA